MRVPFTITSQRHEWTYHGNGERNGQWIVGFETDDGWQSEVIVPDSGYRPQNVAKLIVEQALAMNQIGSLQGAEID